MEDHLLLNENAYIFKKPDGYSLSKSKVKELFTHVSKKSEREGHYLLNQPYETYVVENTPIHYSICVFKFESVPSFIDEYIAGWIETKLAYLILVEFENYIVVTKKNVSGMADFFKLLDPLDYQILSTLFIDDSTLFEKFGLKNMSISDKAIRSKTMESNDLKENFSTIGAGNYIVDSIRLKTGSEKVALSLNTSRINKFGSKNNLDSFFLWAKDVIHKVEHYIPQDTFLTVFAQPISFERERDTLIPIAILFLFTKLYEDFETQRISRCVILTEAGEKVISIFDYLLEFERLLQVSRIVGDDGTVSYFAQTSLVNDLELRINAKSITIFSRKLHNVKLVTDAGQYRSIVEYINTSNQFIVNFDQLELVYTNRKLFLDRRLLGNIDHFMDAFIPYAALEAVTSEKGTFLPTSTGFENNSEFGFVESTFLGEFDFFVCDDLGREWSDHIGLTDDKVTFFHSKYKDTGYSASSFQDVVGQALKNISNLSPRDYQLDSKTAFWITNYNASGITTQITRLRKGTAVNDFTQQFKETTKNPNLNREIKLVINFISKSGLQQKLEDLRDGVAFAERNEVIQILWFLSSFLSICGEQGIKGYICCKP
jgi:hypothetical protein